MYIWVWPLKYVTIIYKICVQNIFYFFCHPQKVISSENNAEILNTSEECNFFKIVILNF